LRYKTIKDLIIKINKKILNKNYIKVFTILFLLMTFIYIFYPYNPFKNVDYSIMVLDEKGKILSGFLNKDEQWIFPSDKNLKIPDKLKKSVLLFEDKYFYYHFGINPFSIARAFVQNISHKRVMSGASTLTMQVVRLSNPKKRTYFNKFIEIFEAIKLEIAYSKDDIFRMYLNHAPYGGNILGYQAASILYYQKIPEELTWSEATTLAVLPNSPSLISPLYNREYLIKKRNNLLTLLLNKNVIDKETYELSIKEPIPSSIQKFNMEARHLSQSLKSKYGSTKKIIKTTIISEYQKNIEELAKNHAKYLEYKGIKNLSALVIETETRKVRAYLGSQNFYDKKNNGEVDGVFASRSTGSILKPFLYALSIDEGLILPQSLITDTPTYFGVYAPENADQKFSGIVTAKEALIRSLNIPAALLLNNYGIFQFYEFLKKAGMTTLFRNSDDYGLTLILGGAEGNLYDIASLYCGLGNYGKFAPLKILADDKDDTQTKTLISEGSSYLTLEMLKELKRPSSEYYWEQFENQYKLAWKTGTSYGQRDAWAVGVSPEWVIAVWVGNFTGETNNNLTGAVSAGLFMFDIFNYLPKNPNKHWFTKPYDNLKRVKICAATGFLASPNCKKVIKALSPMTMKTLKMCPYHKSIYVTNDEKFQVNSLCWESGNYKKVSKLIYPPDVSNYLVLRGQPVDTIPPYKEGCEDSTNKNAIKIIYPKQNSQVWIPRDLDEKLQKVTVRAVHTNKSKKIYWYLDDMFLGETKEKHVKAIVTKKGWHYLEVVDEDGNRDKIKFFVDIKKS